MSKRLFGLPDLLTMFPRSRTQLYRDMRDGLLPYSQVGSRRYFEPADVERYVEALKDERPEVQDLVALIDDDGNFDVGCIPDGCMVPLAELKRAVAERRLQSA